MNDILIMTYNLFKKYDLYFAIICICLYISGLLNHIEVNAFIRMLIFPLLILFYFVSSRKIKKNKYLLCFLIFFGIGDTSYYFLITKGYILSIFLAGTIALVLGYTALIALIISQLNTKQLIKRFPIQIIILTGVGAYLFLKLNSMLEFRHTGEMPQTEYILNIIYNSVIVVLLGLSLLNYFYHDSTVALKLLVACSLLIFSEFVQTAFYFMGAQDLLSNIYNLLLSLSYFAFFTYIKASKNQFKKNNVEIA